MTGKQHLIIGLLIGIFAAALFFQIFAPRYTISKNNGILIKNDKWTGNSWRFINNEWKKNMEIDQDWENVDTVLRDALNIAMNDTNREKVLHILRTKHPLLESVTDDDLLERIKIVYSKEILINLYLNNFLKLQKKQSDIDLHDKISQRNLSKKTIARSGSETPF